MLAWSRIKLFELSWNVSMILNVIVSSIYRVHVLVVSYRYLSHQWIVVSSAISWRCIICRFLYYLLFRTTIVFRWTNICWFGRLRHTHDIILLKLISIIFISRFWLSMYVIEAVVLLLCRWTGHWRLLYLSCGPLLILGCRLLTYNSIFSAFTFDTQRLIFELSRYKWLLLTLDDWSHLFIATRLLLLDILWGQLFRS